MNRRTTTLPAPQTFKICPSHDVPLEFQGHRLCSVTAGGGNQVGRKMQMVVYRTIAGDHLAVVTYTTPWTHELMAKKTTVVGDRVFYFGAEPGWTLDDLIDVLMDEPDPYRYASLNDSDVQERNTKHVLQLWSALRVLATAHLKSQSETA
jgi:hypothetical protein